MEQMSRGDPTALKQVYHEYFESLYQFVRPRVYDQVEAEDVVSEVFLKLVWAFRSRKLPTRSLRGWLFRVARNELNDRYEGSRDDMTCALEDLLPIAEHSDSDTEYEAAMLVDIELMRTAIQQLTPDQQDVIILRYGQMLSLKDTAELMGKNVNAIKVLQFRAINALRRLLDLSEVGVS